MAIESSHLVDGGLRPNLPGVAGLHAREVARVVAYLCSSDRGAGVREAEEVAAEAFLEVASTWPVIAPFSRPEVYVFASARKIAAARAYRGRPSWGDALAESAPTFWDPAEVRRLTILQEALDNLPTVSRHAVLLREMCGFAPSESAEIIGLPEHVVEGARGDALRSLVPVVESRTSQLRARLGPLSPDDFAALARALEHGDRERWAARQHLAEHLAAGYRPGPLTNGMPMANGMAAGQPGGWSPAPSAGWSPSPNGGWATNGFPRPGMSALDMPLSAVDLSSNVGTPIFDAVSAWFASGPILDGDGNPWASLDDGGWLEAQARADATPEVDGLSGAGLPTRRPGANRVPSASEVAAVRAMFGGSPRVDAGTVRNRLDSYQQGLNNARRERRSEVASMDAFSSDTFASGATRRPAPGAGDRRAGWSAPAAPAAPARSAPEGRQGGGGRSARATGSRRSMRHEPAPSSGLPPNPLTPRRSAPRPADSGSLPVHGRAEDAEFAAFYHEFLPQLLAMLMAEGVRPADAAELAEDVLTQTRLRWVQLDEPQDWARNRALAVLADGGYGDR